MIRPTNGTLLITHRGCLDGTGSALVFVLAGGRRDRITFRSPTTLTLKYDEVPSDVTEVWYADCCPPTMIDPAAGRPFRVFDHHVSNQRHFGSDPRCVFDLNRSGTSLLADVLGITIDADHRELIAALEAYDLGRFDHVLGMCLADAAGTYTQDELLDLMIRLGPSGVLRDRDIISRGAAMESIRMLYADSAERAAVYSTLIVPNTSGIALSLSSIRIGTSASPVYWKNEVAERILNSGKADVAVIVDVIGGMVSLRSRGNGPDCSLIAALYGGGGHAKAAAFKIKNGKRMLDLLSTEVFG